VDEATLAELNELVPMYEELVHTAKVHLLQSLVSRILVETVFSAYYPGLSEEQTKQFRQMEELLSSFGTHTNPPLSQHRFPSLTYLTTCTVTPEESINQWRSSTLALLRKESPESLQSGTSAFAEAVVARVNRLLGALTDAVGSDARDAALRVLVNSSVELARLLVVQRAVLRVHMPEILPHQRVPFEPDTMDDIGGEDEDALVHRAIRCVVFPGVIKRGDENGGHMQYRNVIAKARVLCSLEE
jgi:transcription termination factor NusB